MWHTLQSYLAEQQEWLVRALDDPARHPVAVRDAHLSTKLAGSWHWDQSVKGQRAFIRVLGNRREFWVHASFDGYRAAFLRFLERECGLPSTLVPSQEHADHILNAAVARRNGLSFVRMALLQRRFNCQYGATVERAMTQIVHGKDTYLMDYLMMLKLLCMPVPSSVQDFEARKHEMARAFVAVGAIKNEQLALMGLEGFFKLYKII